MRNMREAPIARDCLNTRIPVTGPDNDVFDAIRLLRKEKAPAALVMNGAQGIVGIFSERSALRVLTNMVYDRQPGGVVADYMEPSPESIAPDTDLFMVARRFLDDAPPLLPVTEDGQVLGALTQRDVVMAIETLQGMEVAYEATWDRYVKGVNDPESKEEMQPYLADAPPEQRAESFRNRKTLNARPENEHELPK